MSVYLIVSIARTGNPTLSVKGTSAGEVYKVAVRVNTWLQRKFQFKPYFTPARKDKQQEGLFYSPIPLCDGVMTVSPEQIFLLMGAMDKAGVSYEYHSYAYDYVLVPTDVVPAQPVENPPSNLKDVTPPTLPGKVATNNELKAHLKAQGKQTSGNKADLLARL